MNERERLFRRLNTGLTFVVEATKFGFFLVVISLAAVGFTSVFMT